MQKRFRFPVHLFIIGGIMCVALSSCATIGSLAHNGMSPVFLHISTENFAGASFYVDGKPESAPMTEYSRNQVSENAGYTTYEVISYPAIMVSPHSQYHTLTVESGDKKWNLLLKRDYKLGFLVLDMYLTYGIGNIIDVVTSNIYGYPIVDVDQIMQSANKNLIIFKR
jgi:hypothetical protein